MVTNSGSRVASSGMRSLPAFVSSFSTSGASTRPVAVLASQQQQQQQQQHSQQTNHGNLARRMTATTTTTALRDTEMPCDYGVHHHHHHHASTGSSSHHCRHHSTTATTFHDSKVEEQQQQPLLLLEGDEYYVSHDGVARTFYSLDPSSCYESTFQSSPKHPITIEEYYHLASARKQFILRRNQSHDEKGAHSSAPAFSFFPTTATKQQQQQQVEVEVDVLSSKSQGILPLEGSILQTFEFQEIHDDNQETTNMFDAQNAGTGATTWESSIAMSLFFSVHPELLVGNVLELGSGVGLGGVLLDQVVSSVPQNQQYPIMKSITLTDCNEKVLNQCWDNVQYINATTSNANTEFHVESLNWYDYDELSPSSNKDEKNADTEKQRQRQQRPSATAADTQKASSYDTIIASDVAYLYPDIVALSNTIATLLKRPDKNNNAQQVPPAQAHIFGPYNRGALYELITHLEEQHGLHVVIEWIEMNRYRLKPPPRHTQQQFRTPSNSFQNVINFEEKECPFASKNAARFLHIVASHPQCKENKGQTYQEGAKRSTFSMEDID